MIEQEKIKLNKEKVILVGTVQSNSDDFQVKEHLKELELLVNTAGGIVSGQVIQRVSKINSATFIGKGKANQLISQSAELGVKIIIFDDELTPAQIKNYHKISNKLKVMDRSGLILDIFKKHAKTSKTLF